MSDEAKRTLKEILSEAKAVEDDGNINEASRLYHEAINTDPLHEQAYNRLMMLFRRQKEFKKELQIIKAGITAFQDFYESKIPNKSKTITAISNKLNKSFGLTDNKGNNIYYPEPIGKWKKRKLLVEKKIK